MKPHRDASKLAVRLATAANKPPTLPAVTAPGKSSSLKTAAPAPVAQPTTPKGRPPTDTVGISLRPARTLLQRYTLAAAERTRKIGRVVSAQEMMLEQLEQGPS